MPGASSRAIEVNIWPSAAVPEHESKTSFFLKDLLQRNRKRLPLPKWSPPLGQRFLSDAGYSKFRNVNPSYINHTRIRKCGLVGEDRYSARVSCGIPMKEGEGFGREYVLPLYAEPPLLEARRRMGLPAHMEEDGEPGNASQAKMNLYIYGQRRQEGVKLQHILMNTFEPASLVRRVLKAISDFVGGGKKAQRDGWRRTKSRLFYPVPVDPPKGKQLPLGAGEADDQMSWKSMLPLLGSFYGSRMLHDSSADHAIEKAVAAPAELPARVARRMDEARQQSGSLVRPKAFKAALPDSLIVGDRRLRPRALESFL